MEERGPPASSAADDANNNDDPPLSTSSETQIVSLRYPPPGSETYVVQIPKDQIYRVPPPENALIVERHQKPEKKKTSACSMTRCLVIGAIVFSICLITAITLIALSVTVTPKEPKFSITNVHVKNPKSKSSTGKLGYEISLKVSNPNGHEIKYGNEGASLSFKNKVIGRGMFPLKHQEGDKSATVKLLLDGSKGPLPSDVEKSMEDTDSNLPVSLALNIDLSVKVKGFIKTWNKNTEVECQFKVSTLAKGTKVLHKKCETKFKG